ncbi:MAG: archaetidylserine decarboxylase [Anaeromyxobacteraceae bacterium]
MNDRTFIALMRAVPKNALSRVAGALTRWAAPRWLLDRAITAFAGRYGVDLGECDAPASFRTFGEFFARPLKPGRRPIAAGDEVLASPVDGLVSETGVATSCQLLQAKGIGYTVGALLGDYEAAGRFEGGAWATIYLSPRDYHRIHFPAGGRVTGWRYIPGRLWPVNPASVRTVPSLFAVNERLVVHLETPLGACALVAVGATIVGRVRASFDPSVPITNLPGAAMQHGVYAEPIPVEKGAELGAFEMGSTVILLFEPGRAGLQLAPGQRVRVGEPIGGKV